MFDLKMPHREQNSNKGTFGKVLNFCGSKNYIGAAYLSALSSLRVGAGYSALASSKDVIKSVSILLPEAVYLTREEGVKRLKDFTVVLIGCGLGQDYLAQNLFKKVLKKLQKEQKNLVIDGDGLNLLAKFNYNLPQNTILTPHPLEASRLLNCTLEEILEDLESSAKKITQKYNCVTILKTHRTIICDTSLQTYTNQYGNSALAKAGTGDILAGIITGLLAHKMTPLDASRLGVYLHSRAGEIGSNDLTEYSVLASDLLKYLPTAIKEVI